MLRKDGGHFADDIFKCIFLSENFSISTEISLKYMGLWGVIDNKSVLAWCLAGCKPLSEPILTKMFDDVWAWWVKSITDKKGGGGCS